MESECSRCHRKFQSSTEEMTVCPACLREEFAAAPRTREARQNAALKHENDVSLRRASARAERLSSGLQSGSLLMPHGALRFLLGVVIFLICIGVFMYGSGLEDWQRRMFLPEEAQRAVSILLCWVAAALVFSSRFNKWIVYPTMLFLLVVGWFMPDFWQMLNDRKKKEVAVAIASSRAGAWDETADAEKQPVRPGRVLSEEDLAVYREKKQHDGAVVNYGIYFNVRDLDMRQKVRDALVRLLEAEICVPYTRGKGTLFIVARSAGGTRDISALLARFGELNYHSAGEGIYEIVFSPEKVYAVSPYPSEVFSSPHDESFVPANLAELSNLLDPRRVLMAANVLASANVAERRAEVRKVLGDVLRDPWTSEAGTYKALVEALATYATSGDREAVDICRRYFLSCRIAHRLPSPVVMELLIREVPSEMVGPVVDLWRSNPQEWSAVLSQLGTMSQDYLLEMLEETSSNQLKVSIIRHLESHGTPEAVPTVTKYLKHPDPAISHAARITLSALGTGAN